MEVNMQRPSPRFRSVQFLQVRDIRRYSSTKFIDLCKETPCWWPIRVVPTGRVETNIVPEFCYESVNSYLEELINF